MMFSMQRDNSFTCLNSLIIDIPKHFGNNQSIHKQDHGKESYSD